MKLMHTVDDSDNKKRLTDVLCDTLGMSRLLVKRIRIYGEVTVNGAHYRMIDPVHAGDVVHLLYKEPDIKEDRIIKDRGDIKVLFCDEHLLIVSKPSGIVTHHTSNHQSNTLLDFFDDLKLHPVSRLDRETSGIIILARDPHSHYRLSMQHQNKTMEKEYTAINHGIFPFDSGIINAPIKRKPHSIMLRCVAPDGDVAITHFRTIKKFAELDVSIVKFRLETGRTHQIRVHSLFCNHPIIGDGLYGASSNDNRHYQKSAFLDAEIGRQALHASYVAFNHPVSNERLEFTDEIPTDMKNLVLMLENQEK